MKYSKKSILLLVIVLLIVTTVILSRQSNYASIKQGIQSKLGIGEIVKKDGYLIKSWEALYLAPNSPVIGNDKSEKIWIKDNNSKKTEDFIKNLSWGQTENGIQYTKVSIEGKLYGPGIYGGAGGYAYEIDLRNLKSIE